MTAITLDAKAFGGIAPRYAKTAMPGGFACSARNVDLTASVLRSFRTPRQVSDQTGASIRKTSCCLFVDDCTVSYAEPHPQCGFLYRVKNGVLQMTDNQGPDCSESDWWDLGFESDMPAPVVESLDPIEEGYEMEETSAVYVVVDRFGNRSAPSAPSYTARVMDSGEVMVSGLPTDYPARWRAESVEVYLFRTGSVSGDEEASSNGAYFLADTVPIGTPVAQVYMDRPGRMLDTEDYAAPPERLMDLHAWQDGQMAGLAGGRLRFSGRNAPVNWSEYYEITFFDFPLRFVAGRTTGYVLTRGQPAVIELNATCDAPFCHRAFHVNESLPIMSRESAVMFGDDVVYASRQGLIRLQPSGQWTNISAPWFDRRAWESLYPTTIKAARWGSMYVMVTAKGSFMLDVSAEATRGLMPIDLDAKAMTQGDDGFFYFATDAGVYQWDAGDDFMDWSWTSTPVRFGDWTSLWGYLVQVVHPEVRARLFAGQLCDSCEDGELIADEVIEDCEPLPLPIGSQGQAFWIELSGKGEVASVRMATEREELFQ